MSNKIRHASIAFLFFAISLSASSTNAAAFVSLPEPAAPASPASIERTFRPVADAYTLRSSATANFGEYPFLEITNEPDLEPWNAGSLYLRFDLSSIPDGVTLEWAKIRFYLPPGGYGADCLLDLKPIADPWDELTINFENAPALASVANLQRHLPSGVEQWEWEITEIVEEWLATRPLTEMYGLAISPQMVGPDYVHFFSSREGQRPPELTISYTLDERWYSFQGHVATYTQNPGEQRPVANATIALYEAYPWDPGLGYPLGHLETTAQTNPNGEFALHYYYPSDTPPITYTLVVSSTEFHAIDAIVPPPGYATPERYIRYNPDTPAGFYPDNHFIVAPDEVPDWEYWRFNGQVFSENPAVPAEGVSVVLYGTHNINESENLLAGAATDENGQFSLLAARRAGEAYPLFVLKVDDYNFNAYDATPAPGGDATPDHKLVFTTPPPDEYHGNLFAVAPVEEDLLRKPAQASSFRNQPVVALILNYNCSCGTASDCQHITNTKVQTAFGESLFSTTGDSLNLYFLENSQYNHGLKQAGLYSITPTDDPNTTLDESSNCSRNESLEKSRAYYVRDLLGTQAGFDFAAYDKNSDGTVDNSELIVVVAYATPNHWVGKVRSTDPSEIQIGSVKVKMEVASFSVAQDFYTIAHELGHATTRVLRSGTLGDNYGGQGNPGAYGLMDNHCSGYTWGAMNAMMPNTPITGTTRIYSRRPHLDPWNKIQLGWIISDTYSIPHWVTFDPIEDDGYVYRVGTGKAGEYFLVENRYPSSSKYDTALLDSGLAIWHINENYMPDEFRTIALERSGGGANSGQSTTNCDDDTDSTALWDGTEDFWNGSSPSSKWYSGTVSYVGVSCISPPSDQVSAYLSSSWTQTNLAHDSSEPNDTEDYAKPVSAGTYDRNLHASCDTDVYTITHWISATIGVTVSAYQDAGHTIPATAPSVLLEQDDFPSTTTYQGVGSASGFFKEFGTTYIKVYNSSQPVYYRMEVTNSKATVPPDSYDDETPAGEPRNDTFVNSAVITDTIDENAVWWPGLTVTPLNFHTTSDVDYFTFTLPPEVDASGREECLDPSDPEYSPEVITGSLTVKVVPTIKNAFDIRAYNSSGTQFTQYKSLGAWSMRIDCPNDHFSDGELTFRFREATSSVNFYKIELSYNRWYVEQDFPSWLLRTDPPLVRPIPEIYDPWIKLIYPFTDWVQWALFGGTAQLPLPTEYLPVRHNVDGPFHLSLVTQAWKDLNLRLYNSEQVLVGVGMPLGALQNLSDNPFMLTQPPGYAVRRLDIPFLPAGWYAIALDGVESFTEYWLKFSNHWLFLPVMRK